MLAFISVAQCFKVIDLFIHSLYSFRTVSVYAYLIFFCANNLHEPPELLLKKYMVSHMRFVRVSMGIFPSENARSLQVDISLFSSKSSLVSVGSFFTQSYCCCMSSL